MFNAVSVVTLFSLLTQFSGFLRILIIAAALGVSETVDVYNLGLIIPSLVTSVSAGWLQGAYVGRYVSMISRNELASAADLRRRMLRFLCLLALAVAVVCMLFAEQILSLFLLAPQIAAAADVLRITIWLVLAVMLADFMGLTLNGHGRFTLAAAAPLLNALVSVSSLWLWPEIDLSALMFSLLLGGLAQLLVVGFPYYRLIAPASTARAGSLDLIANSPLLPALLLINSQQAVIQFQAARLGEGAVALVGYASRFHGALSQLLIIGLSTVLLPLLARLWAEQKYAEVELLFCRLLRLSLLIAVLVLVLILLIGEDLVALVFVRRAFDMSNAVAVTHLWLAFTWALFPLAVTAFIAKLAQAIGATTAFLLSAALGFFALTLVAWLGARGESLSVIAFAAPAGASVTALFWLIWLSRRLPMLRLITDLFASLPRVGLLVLPMVLLDGLLIATLPDLWPLYLQLLIRGGGLLLIFLAVFFGMRQYRWYLK